MALTPGTRLGPYEIRSALGAGGMGEVYRATDTTLGRDVAIKVLPDVFARDPERLARFEREAKTLAALNHPHIAHIYGLERTEGMSALVLELVEGPTLADRIAQGAVPYEEALPIATQIAAALEAAHEQGVIHRDVKPANIKVTPDGVVKVLDFGLAKLHGPAEAGHYVQDLAASPTITSPAGMTGVGVILGTAAYMSPEQTKGREADRRSDVWAFGCVLYEMLTGTRAFDGDDVSDTLASVLKSEPNWNALPADLPVPIRTLIERCLVKDRRARVAAISVAQFVLAEASALAAGPAGPAEIGHYVPVLDVQRQIDGAVAAARRTLILRRVLPIAAAVLLTAMLAGLGVLRLMPSTPSLPVAFSFTLPEGQQFSSTGRQMLAISPDGTQVVYVATDAATRGTTGTVPRLYLRSLSEFDARPIPGTELKDGVTSPVFSPDGASLAFFYGGTVKRIPVSGGAAVTICPAENPWGMAWDSSGIVFGQARGVFRCPANGGAPEQLASVEENERPYGPQILPGGEALLFTIAKVSDETERWDKAQIVVQSIPSGARTTVVNGGSDGRYLRTGHLLYTLGGIVFARPFDPERREVTGGPVGVVEGVRRTAGTQVGAAQLHASDTGTLLYVPGPVGSTTTERAVAVADRTGAITRLTLPAKPYVHVRASRDGTRIALDSDDGKEAIVWTHQLAATSEPTRLTFVGKNRFPILSSDGQRVAFQSDREGDLAIFVQRADGTQVERLTKPEKGDAHVPESWSPDGRHISFSVIKGSTSFLWTLSLEDKKPVLFGNVQSSEPIDSVISPDGRWIAYHSRQVAGPARSPSNGVFVEPFPATGVQYQTPKLELDFQPLWSLDGKELIYVPTAASGRLAAVSVSTRSGVTFGSPRMLPATVTSSRASGLTRAFDILPNGRFIGLVSGPDDNEPGPAAARDIRVVLNWFDELKRLVPVK